MTYRVSVATSCRRNAFSLGLVAIATSGLLLAPAFLTLPLSTGNAQSLPSLTASTLNASKNIARQTAERANGGLSQYRAELSMHGPALESPYVDGGDVWIFRFRGGAPGATELTVESEIAVDKETLASTIVYNGPPREQSGNSGSSFEAAELEPEPLEPAPQDLPQQQRSAEVPTTAIAPVSPEAIDEPSSATPLTVLPAAGDVNTAKNLARQAGERVNGGLSQYRAEAAMHGPGLEAPFVDRGDAWIFTFRGAPPGETDFTVETEVEVVKFDLATTVIYNGPLR